MKELRKEGIQSENGVKRCLVLTELLNLFKDAVSVAKDS